MRKLKIPGTDIEISVISYGVANFGTEVKGSDADRLVSEYLASGGNILDTAHCYAFWEKDGLGASERELGACIRRLGCRESVVIVTKGGHPDGGPDYPRPKEFLSEKTINSDIQESLDRLGFDSIDIYFLHRDDGHTPVSEIIGMMNSLVKTGRIRNFGASNWSVERMEQANRYAQDNGLMGFSISQVQWSLAKPDWKITPDPVNRFVSSSELAYHSRTGMPLMAFSAAACGYFAGKGFDTGMFACAENSKKYQRSFDLSLELGCTPTQIAVSWLLHQPFPVIPLFSTGSMDHMREVMASETVRLSPEQVGWLSASD